MTNYKCRQCHYFWDTYKSVGKCFCIDGNKRTTEVSNACENFDYWRNYENVMSDGKINLWLKLSGEANESGQIKLF